MSRLVNTTTMTVDGVTDVGDWFVSDGSHNHAAREQFEGAAGMVLHPTVRGEGTRPYLGKTVRMRLLDSTSYDSGVTQLRYEPLTQ